MIDFGQEMYMLLFGVLLLCGSAVCMHYTNRIFDLNCISIPAFFYFTYALTAFIPAFFIFYEKTGPYRFGFIYCIMSVFITVPLGIILVNVLLKYNSREMERFFLAPVKDEPKKFTRILNYSLCLLLAIGLFLGWCYEQQGPIPLLYMLKPRSEQALNLMLLREYSFKLLDSPFRYLYHTTRDFLFPLLIVVALGNYYHSRSRTWLFFLLVASLFGFFFGAANVAKGPFAAIVLIVLFSLYFFRRKKVSWLQVGIGCVLLFAFPLVVYTVGNGLDFGTALIKLLIRIFVAPTHVVYYGWEIVPERYPFQMGRGTGPIAMLFGMEPSDIGKYSAWYMMGTDTTTSVSGVFVTQLYGDFGYIGVVVGGLIVGISMQWIHISIVRGEKTIFAIATYVLFLYFYSWLTTLQLIGALLLSGAPFLWLMYKTKFLG